MVRISHEISHHRAQMEPISISASCVGIVKSIVDLSLLIGKFVANVRDARKDMDAVQRELSSLRLCVESLQTDSQNPDLHYPAVLQRSLVDVLANCDGVIAEMTRLLQKMSSSSIGRYVQWVANGRGDMDKLRSRLEAHKATIDIALDMVSM